MAFKTKKLKQKAEKSVFNIKKFATEQIGDGKTPNKYWVSISEDYLVNNKNTNEFNPISEFRKGKYQGKTLKEFNNYEEAKQFADSLEIGSWKEGMEVNSIFIEDRLAGEVYDRERNWFSEDIGFTKKFEEEKKVPSTIFAPKHKGDFVSQIMAYESGEMTPSQEDNFLKENASKLRNFQGSYGRELARRGY